MPVSKRKIKVHLFRTLDCELENFTEIADVLKNSSTSIELILKKGHKNKEYCWIPYEPFTHNETFAGLADIGFFNANSISGEFSNKYLEQQRTVLKIKKESFTVILTKQKLADNCFSIYDLERNIIVRTSDWKEYAELNPAYTTSLVIIESIARILLGIDFYPFIFSYDSLSPINKIRQGDNSKQPKRFDENFLIRYYFKNEEEANLFNFGTEHLKKIYLAKLKFTIGIKATPENNSSSALEVNLENKNLDVVIDFLNAFKRLTEDGANSVIEDSKKNSTQSINKGKYKKTGSLSATEIKVKKLLDDSKRNELLKIWDVNKPQIFDEVMKALKVKNRQTLNPFIKEVNQKLHWVEQPKNGWQIYLAAFIYSCHQYGYIDISEYSFKKIKELCLKAFDLKSLDQANFNGLLNGAIKDKKN